MKMKINISKFVILCRSDHSRLSKTNLVIFNSLKLNRRTHDQKPLKLRYFCSFKFRADDS